MKTRTRQPLTPLDRLIAAAVRQARGTDPALYAWLLRLRDGDRAAQSRDARQPQPTQAGQGGRR